MTWDISSAAAQDIGNRTAPPFESHGRAGAMGPVVLAVPHAGRDYTPALLAQARGGLAVLSRLEDRHADSLVALAVAAGHPAIIAREPRASIDLNRDERELDTATVVDLPHGLPVRHGPKLRSGLGLIPRSLGQHGALWRRSATYAEVLARIGAVHAPYHEAIGEALTTARAAHGQAILIDVHSMPSLRPAAGQAPAQIVIGDRFGQSASGQVTALVESILCGAGYRVAINAPYAGGYTLERHGAPRRAVHAIQLEVDRALYLVPEPDGPGAPGPGTQRLGRLILRLAEALGDAFGGAALPMAAE